ncbi:hypothetical protein HELRODRAFT_97580 [Helobdella robusta]|uniref:HELP domain-containing protein n=1 Tax=Helobdella robusta TaxID=6412 RepID=T1G9H7_HELRO|nr:hypothetical protein HELRODRAFT_97580 [Helobdella robusta]ESO09467.1 hypothetical protein HELRODRAFT_97580 [Helobdella robusta]
MKFYVRGRPLIFYAPSLLGNDFLTRIQAQPPRDKLILEWVYGYRGKDARSNIFMLPTGEIVYFIAAVAVLYNVDEQTQRHYVGHTDDIKCIAIHPDKVTIATGQVAGHDKSEGKPHVRIWNSITLATLKIIGLGDFERAVSCVTFSKVDGGNHLAVVDDANDHVLSVWDWQKSEKGTKILEAKNSGDPVFFAEYNPVDANSIVTCGKGQITFWSIEGTSVVKKTGIFEKLEKPKYVTCLAFTENGKVVSGDSAGNLIIWSKGSNKVHQALTGAHEGGVFCICILKDGCLLSGGKDKKIVKWVSTDAGYERSKLPEAYGPVRQISEGAGNVLLVGTTKNCILQGSFDLKFNPVVQGHVEELWGLATLPSQNQFLTCGYDRMLYLWDSPTHRVVWSKEMPESCHAIAIHSEGQIAIVTGTSPRWYVFDVASREVVGSNSDATERIECVQFSPESSMLACGSRDNFIYVYSVADDGKKYSKVAKLSGHSSFILHVDWSIDSQYLQSNSGDYELLFWNMATFKQITTASTLRDVVWATTNCTLCFSSCGIWPEGVDGTDINACTRSHDNYDIVSADDFGKVAIYAYPAFHPKSPGFSYSGHSSHVTNVKFLHDDTRLISTGGKDTSIMQWQVVNSSNCL